LGHQRALDAGTTALLERVTFRLIYDQQILVEGASILDLLRQFQELLLIIENGCNPSFFSLFEVLPAYTSRFLPILLGTE